MHPRGYGCLAALLCISAVAACLGGIMRSNLLRLSAGKFGLETHTPVPVSWEAGLIRWTNPANGVDVRRSPPLGILAGQSPLWVPSDGGIRSVLSADPGTYWTDFAFDTAMANSVVIFVFVTPATLLFCALLVDQLWPAPAKHAYKWGISVGVVTMLTTVFYVAGLVWAQSTPVPSPALSSTVANVTTYAIASSTTIGPCTTPNARCVTVPTKLNMAFQWQIFNTTLVGTGYIACPSTLSPMDAIWCNNRMTQTLTDHSVEIQVPVDGSAGPVQVPYGSSSNGRAFARTPSNMPVPLLAGVGVFWMSVVIAGVAMWCIESDYD